MLAITETAAAAIKTLMSTADMPTGAGLRISASELAEGLELSVRPGPAADDVVVEGGGATIFLAPAAAEVLENKVLDVEPVTVADGTEELRFAIGSQPDQV